MFWRPLTCDCHLEVNDRWNWVSTVKKCRLHNSLNGQALLNEVLAQCRRFSLAFGTTLTDSRKELITTAESVNKLRIRHDADLSNFDEHLPFEQPLTFFQNLRRVLRLNP